MFPFLRLHLKLWALWITGASVLLFANPWGRFGWVELAAIVGPLMMAVDRRIRREPALAIGLPVITILWLALPGDAGPVPLLLAWVVFGVGVLLGARTIDSHTELESIAGRVAFAPPDRRTFEQFELALERELGRARRHERPFVLLSVAAHPHSFDAEAAGAFKSELLRALEENRARLELHELLLSELHVYSDIVAARDRVLALVPEIDPASVAALIERIQRVAAENLDFDVQIGVGCFPRDAVCGEELIQAADRDRTASKLRPLPKQSVDEGVVVPAELAPDVTT